MNRLVRLFGTTIGRKLVMAGTGLALLGFVLVHMIGDDALMNDLSVATKLVPEPSVLAALKAAGRGAAQDFLDRHWDRLGRESNVDLRAMFG